MPRCPRSAQNQEEYLLELLALLCHADTHKLALVRCRGVRRMHLRSNMPDHVQAPDSHIRLICAWLIARANFRNPLL